MGIRRPVFWLMTACFILSGCASGMDERLTLLENNMVKQEIMDLRVAAVEDRLNLLERDLGALGARVEGIETQKGGKTAATQKKINPRPTPAPAVLKPAAANKNPAPLPSIPDPKNTQAPTQPAPPPPASPTSPALPSSAPSGQKSVMVAGEQAAYDKALAAYNSKRYAVGETLFAQFLQTYPSGKLAPNAGYWLGECYYSQRKLDSAILAFKNVVGKFPKHEKAAASLLKAGYSYAMLGDNGNARFYIQMLIDDFPSSGTATLGRKKLNSLGP